MGGGFPIAPRQEVDRLGLKRKQLSSFGKNEVVLFDPAVGMKAGRNLGRRLRIGIDRRRRALGRPAFEEGLAFGNPRLRSEIQQTAGGVNPAPPFWPKLTEGIVLSSNPLQVKDQVTFIGPRLFVAW
jgi:hypothetical protein